MHGALKQKEHWKSITPLGKISSFNVYFAYVWSEIIIRQHCQFAHVNYLQLSLWNNSLISISILRDYWLETMRDGHKLLLIYLDKCMGVYLNPLLHA